MDKRLYKKASTHLTYRHYLFHFKWPLLGFIVVMILLSLLHRHFPSEILKFDENLSSDVIYPIEIFDENNSNKSILYSFIKKDQLKAIDDARSIKNKHKIILPLEHNKSSSNSYLILEFTHVFGRPRFCTNTKEEIFGKTCPFKNWYVYLILPLSK